MSRQLNMVIVCLSLALVMTQFQNCAGPSNASSSTGAGSTVHLISDYTQTGLQFPVMGVHLAEQADRVQLGGICDRSHTGQSFEWSVTVSGSAIASGEGLCQHGQFIFTLTNASRLICGVTYEVNVSSSWGAGAQMTLEKLCEPLASGPLVDLPESESQPQDCHLEYRLSADGSDQGLCQAVCFRQSILSSQEDRPLEECESLIDQASRR
jgi:hypothetical protein